MPQDTKIQEKDSEVLRLLNQIATDMIRKDDVDRLIKEAVEKGILKPLDPSTAPRYMKYIPIWA